MSSCIETCNGQWPAPVYGGPTSFGQVTEVKRTGFMGTVCVFIKKIAGVAIVWAVQLNNLSIVRLFLFNVLLHFVLTASSTTSTCKIAKREKIGYEWWNSST
jgi:hypothetical protein